MSLTDHWKVVCDRENAPPISLHRLAVGGIFLVCFRITDMASLGENDKGEVFARYQWHYLCWFYLLMSDAIWKSRKMPMNTNSVLVEEHDREDFESVTEEEIIYLWRSIKGRG